MAVPVAESGAVRRPRLAGRVAAALADGHVLLVAPAGYGKTTLAAEALRHRDDVAAWHVCRRGDADALRLLGGLAGAIDRARPGAAAAVLDALEAAADAPALTAALAAEVDGLLVDPLVVVVDDAEHLAASRAAAEVLEALATGAARLRLLVATRREVSLRAPGLTSALRLGPPELAFDADEAERLLEQRLGRPPADGEVRDLLERTLGWPLGLALGDAPTADPEALVTRLLHGLDDAVRARLLESAAVDELTPGVRAALPLAGHALAAARQAGLAPRPGLREGALAWHPLVREALRAVWEATAPPADHDAVLRRAGEALAAEGRAAASADALRRAGEHVAALDVLLARADRLLRTAPSVVAEGLDALPATRASEPVAVLLRGWLAFARGHVGHAVAALRTGLRALEAGGRGAEGAGARLALVESLYFLGRFDEAEQAAAALADDPAAPPAPAAVAGAWRALVLSAAGRDADARRRMQDVLERDADGSASGLVAAVWAFLDAPAGRQQEAIRALDEAHARLIGEPRAAGRPEYLTSLSAFMCTDLGLHQEAVRRADRMVADREPDGLPPFVAELAHQLQAWTRAQAGDLAGAEAAAQLLHPERLDGWSPAFGVGAAALIAGGRGDAAGAVALARRAAAVGRSAPLVHRVNLVLPLAAGLLDAGEPAVAVELLDALLASLPGHATFPRARAHTLRAAAGAALGRDWTVDGQAVLRAAGQALTAVLGADWPRIRPLVWEALDSPATGRPAVLHAVLAAVPAADVPDFAAHPRAAVRAALAPRLAASGHPAARARLAELAADADREVRAAGLRAAEQARARPAALRIRVLGGFALTRGGWPVDERAWTRPTAARLVRRLLVAGGTAVGEDRLASELWPDHDGEAARSALRMAVSRARQALDGPQAPASRIVHRDGTYRLALGPADELDAERFRALATDALAATAQRRGRLATASAAWAGEPLPEDRYAEWAASWCGELLDLRGRVLAALAAEHRAAGDEHAVAAVARTLLADDPLDEAAHRLLMTALARTGRRSLALRQFLDCRRRLVDELGLEPSAETAGLHARLLAGLAV